MRSITFLKTLTLAALFPLASAAADLVLHARADSWMPFNGDPKADVRGYVVDILDEVFQAKGIRVEYNNLAWKDTLVAVKEGKVDAAIGANPTEAKGLVIGQESIGEPRMGIFVLKDIQWSYNNIQSLSKIRLGVISGYSYWDSLDTYIASAEKEHLAVFSGDTPLVDGLSQLDQGKIDAMAETFPVFVWAVKNSGRKVSDYRVAFKQAGEPVYVAFTDSPAGRSYAAILDDGIKALRASGKLDTILKRYGLTDWTK